MANHPPINFPAEVGDREAVPIHANEPNHLQSSEHRSQGARWQILAVAAPLFYIAAVNRLGFIVVATLILLALFLKLQVRPVVAVAVALVTVFVIHGVFYKLLRVSLPWGVLPILY